jgi:hypothetical protein
VESRPISAVRGGTTHLGKMERHEPVLVFARSLAARTAPGASLDPARKRRRSVRAAWASGDPSCQVPNTLSNGTSNDVQRDCRRAEQDSVGGRTLNLSPAGIFSPAIVNIEYLPAELLLTSMRLDPGPDQATELACQTAHCHVQSTYSAKAGGQPLARIAPKAAGYYRTGAFRLHGTISVASAADR